MDMLLITRTTFPHKITDNRTISTSAEAEPNQSVCHPFLNFFKNRSHWRPIIPVTSSPRLHTLVRFSTFVRDSGTLYLGRREPFALSANKLAHICDQEGARFNTDLVDTNKSFYRITRVACSLRRNQVGPKRIGKTRFALVT